ncbi:MAG: hypothetical protein KZQ96_07280 [Candidatus Thiodiazotropha sp. (ex Lucinoma borealis)]|nr:hypothetical protein [Candidatus Thiodiazotropha sp. (ex Lucinoma borealis)]MCU7855048.1 hypothetical protein [Candidatus Thiodiazotropha sp. (ex Lucinoma borealis)]MCU7870038.1 hypothetical protein [Candidatus Thiodiazotropha sp. (ex Lucinoma borealis)]
MSSSSAEMNSKKAESEKTITQLVYALQAASFLFVITFLVAVIINYVKKDDVENTWLESHFRWQIRTFWYSLLWMAVGFLTTLIVVGYIVLFVNAVWLIYRIVKGWLRLADEKEMYTTG